MSSTSRCPKTDTCPLIATHCPYTFPADNTHSWLFTFFYYICIKIDEYGSMKINCLFYREVSIISIIFATQS